MQSPDLQKSHNCWATREDYRDMLQNWPWMCLAVGYDEEAHAKSDRGSDHDKANREKIFAKEANGRISTKILNQLTGVWEFVVSTSLLSKSKGANETIASRTCQVSTWRDRPASGSGNRAVVLPAENSENSGRTEAVLESWRNEPLDTSVDTYHFQEFKRRHFKNSNRTSLRKALQRRSAWVLRKTALQAAFQTVLYSSEQRRTIGRRNLLQFFSLVKHPGRRRPTPTRWTCAKTQLGVKGLRLLQTKAKRRIPSATQRKRPHVKPAKLSSPLHGLISVTDIVWMFNHKPTF